LSDQPVPASIRYHRAVVRKVANSINSTCGKYEMVKVTFMLFTPGYAGEEIERFYCIRAASYEASPWALKEGKANLAKLYYAACKQTRFPPDCLVDSVVMIRLLNKPRRCGNTWITIANVKAAEPFT
jgi:hypothetical protein